MRMIPMLEWGKKSRIIAALTDGTTRSYDAIVAELGLSTHYVRSVASRFQRSSGTVVRRQKPTRERKSIDDRGSRQSGQNYPG